MESYNWPGNVRELENAIEHAAALSGDPVLGDALAGDPALGDPILGVDSLPMSLRSWRDKQKGQGGTWWLERLTLAEAELRMIEAAMSRTNDNMTRAARQLGITRRALGYRLRKYGLYGKELDEEETAPPAEREIEDPSDQQLE